MSNVQSLQAQWQQVLPSISPYPDLAVLIRVARPRCPHIKETCRNRALHPRYDVVYLKNAEVQTFNGCGYCKWARSNTNPKLSGYQNPGWPGCCRPPNPSEHKLVPAADWPTVSLVHRIPIPSEIKAILESITGQRTSTILPFNSGSLRGSHPSSQPPSLSRRTSSSITVPTRGDTTPIKASPVSIPTKTRSGGSPQQLPSALGTGGRNANADSVSCSLPNASAMDQVQNMLRRPAVETQEKRRDNSREAKKTATTSTSVNKVTVDAPPPFRAALSSSTNLPSASIPVPSSRSNVEREKSNTDSVRRRKTSLESAVGGLSISSGSSAASRSFAEDMQSAAVIALPVHVYFAVPQSCEFGVGVARILIPRLALLRVLSLGISRLGLSPTLRRPGSPQHIIMGVPPPGISNDPLLWLLTAATLLSTALFVLRGKSKQSISRPPIRPSVSASAITNGVRKTSPVKANNDVPPKVHEVTVSKILVHPIKSLSSAAVYKSRYTSTGLENDRKWCIIDANTHHIITARELPKMVLLEPTLVYDITSEYEGKLIVSVPKGADFVTFHVPIAPTPDILETWSIIEECIMFGTYKMDGFICEPLSPSDPSPTEILSEYLGKKVHLMMKGPTPRSCPPTTSFPDLDANSVYQDGYPLLVASEESLHAVGENIKKAAAIGPDGPNKIGGMDYERWADEDIPIERFRPNIVLRGVGVPFTEDSWKKIAIGPKHDTRLRQKETMNVTLVSRCARCLLPNVDPQTGVRDAAVPYKVLMKFRTGVDPANMNKPCFGCNGVPEDEGTVQVGDFVTVLEHAEIEG
ncbi:hypothetical protein NM688_g7061 [Phlebia brevispora]|uniref:Uncharacterized protein n=1 Tax=Phlebia brevispora TaxID=194682 RepID=A0ACC1S9N4_9APHY|nr:hypothetical protein NM688_g7061 [Phlebia brevispora]